MVTGPIAAIMDADQSEGEFPENIQDNQDMLDSWEEYQARKRGIAPLAAEELRAWGAPI